MSERMDQLGGLPMFTEEDAREGVRRKEAELDKHELSKKERIRRARAYARWVSEGEGRVTADDVRAYCANVGIESGPWMGSVFRGKDWQHIGWTQSKDPVQHARSIRIWRYSPQKES